MPGAVIMQQSGFFFAPKCAVQRMKILMVEASVEGCAVPDRLTHIHTCDVAPVLLQVCGDPAG